MTILTAERTLGSPAHARYPVAAIVVAMLSLASASIHLYVVPEHLEQWWVFAAFFVAMAVGQLLTASLVLWRPRPALLLAAAIANVWVVILWVVSRTAGLPIGPPVADFTAGLADPSRGGYGEHASGVPEPVGLLDVSATVFELLVVVALVSLLPVALRRRTGNFLCLVGMLLWSLYLLGVLS